MLRGKIIWEVLRQRFANMSQPRLCFPASWKCQLRPGFFLASRMHMLSILPCSSLTWSWAFPVFQSWTSSYSKSLSNYDCGFYVMRSLLIRNHYTTSIILCPCCFSEFQTNIWSWKIFQRLSPNSQLPTLTQWDRVPHEFSNKMQ